MAKGDYLYDAEVVITNPEGSGSHFTVYQVRDGQMFGPRHMEPGTSITRTAKIGQGLVIVNNKSKDLPGLTLQEKSHLGPECSPDQHTWHTTEHGHDICLSCKAMRPTSSVSEAKGKADGG